MLAVEGEGEIEEEGEEETGLGDENWGGMRSERGSGKKVRTSGPEEEEMPAELRSLVGIEEEGRRRRRGEYGEKGGGHGEATKQTEASWRTTTTIKQKRQL